jgi:hypothetical protein
MGASTSFIQITGSHYFITFQNETNSEVVFALESVGFGVGARGPLHFGALAPGGQAHVQGSLHGVGPAEFLFYAEAYATDGELLTQNKVVHYGHEFFNPFSIF